jgi:hypothetical protein
MLLRTDVPERRATKFAPREERIRRGKHVQVNCAAYERRMIRLSWLVRHRDMSNNFGKEQ